MSRPVLRFAPSPNGRLHLGHALSALLNARMARALGGRLLVRIEDIDAARCTPELEAGVLEDLAWLGLDWERPVRRQSEHFSDYRAALDRLAAMGLLRKTFLTRGEIARAVARLEEERGAPWPCDPDGAPLYPGDEAVLSPAEIAAREAQGAPFALRLDMRAALGRCKAPLSWQELQDDEARGAPSRLAADPARWGDVVLARKDTPTSYHLSVVVDDARQGVTHVVRGKDLFEATAVHRLLQVLLGLPEPLYRHHRLILDADGRKLSKSQGDTALAELRARGATPEEIRRRIGLDPDA
ncbi:tRNA glutamyl-Q(34) synthetase GluQRS [Stappia sp. TSB10GB4]|uniref:tRNA glutamyl-Q(34) synthetase GluQRS n=1 Tax=Stappia sp. TSB10GB4 TaxID=2003584 RepID=UPI001645B545|nr:tRNA glutamyl-Q(34) synthetase GluQRS [Stappia sp. TSB10GB4]